MVADDNAVLISNRLPTPLPVVDDVDLRGVQPGALNGVEVVASGRALRTLTDQIALTHAFGLPLATLRRSQG